MSCKICETETPLLQSNPDSFLLFHSGYPNPPTRLSLYLLPALRSSTHRIMATSTPTTTPKFPIASPESYLPLRLALLEKEKAHTRAHDAITAERRALPLVEITKPYTFTTLDSNGQEKTVTLLDLFEGRRQLIVKHFMFGPDSTEGCVSCSMGADVSNSHYLHSIFSLSSASSPLFHSGHISKM